MCNHMVWTTDLGASKPKTSQLRHCNVYHLKQFVSITARSVEDETRNAELNGNRNAEWWGKVSQLVKIERIKSLGISRYKGELRFWLDLSSEIFRGTNSNWDFCLIWICSWLKSPHHSGFRLPFNSAFRVSSSTERAVIPRNFLEAWIRNIVGSYGSWLYIK